MTAMTLWDEIAACRLCAEHLPLGPRPIVRADSPKARVLIIGQAPGTRVHASGIPWDDASGERLRGWMGVEASDFYDTSKFAIMPMGFCYPGRGKGGDSPPRPECAPTWHQRVRAELPNVELSLLIGAYAQRHYLGDRRRPTLSETVLSAETYAPEGLFPLVHPSPRNRLWLAKNPWFEAETVPILRQRLRALGL